MVGIHTYVWIIFLYFIRYGLLLFCWSLSLAKRTRNIQTDSEIITLSIFAFLFFPEYHKLQEDLYSAVSKIRLRVMIVKLLTFIDMTLTYV